jgi:hypothetical protein
VKGGTLHIYLRGEVSVRRRGMGLNRDESALCGCLTSGAKALVVGRV